MKKRIKSLVALVLIISTFLLPNIALGAPNYGYIPDPLVGVPTNSAGAYRGLTAPDAVDWSKYVIEIEDQGGDPWCVAYGVVAAIESQMRLKGLAVPDGGFSQAYLYARCKQLDGIPTTEGTYIRTALNIAMTEGLVPDYMFPTAQYKNKGQVPQITPELIAAAADYKVVTSAVALTDTEGYADMEAARAAMATGHLVVLGTFVEQSWNTADGGWLLDPYGHIRGSHCTMLDGYNRTLTYMDYTGFYDGVNSWGYGWGMAGKYKMSYRYADWRDLSVGMPMVLEAWAFEVAGSPENVSYINMPIPLQIINPGYTVLPFRIVFEALGGTVDWGRNTDGKIWVRGTVELKYDTVTLEMVQGDPVMKVTRS